MKPAITALLISILAPTTWKCFPIRFNGIRGPIQSRLDFGLIKNFAITERWKLQFRAKTFNAANYANLRRLRHHHRSRPAPLLAGRTQADLLGKRCF